MYALITFVCVLISTFLQVSERASLLENDNTRDGMREMATHNGYSHY